MTREISNTDDVIDSRDVIARIEELRADWQAAVEDGTLDMAIKGRAAWAAEYPDEDAELTALEALADEAEGTPDWQYGETLVRDSYFEDYAQRLAEDCGMIPENRGWPACHIDWEAAADALKADYFTVDFDGVAYWVRS